MKKIVIILAFLFLPVVSNALMQISDNFTLGPSGYWGNSTDVVLELPAEFNIQGGVSISSSGGNRSLSYSLGGGKDLFFQMMSINTLYNADRSSSYISDGADLSFSIRPFMGLSTFVDIQLEAGYSFTGHTNTNRTQMLPSHSIKIGAGLGILQTTNFAIAYTSYIYLPSIPDGYDLKTIQTYIYATRNFQLAGVLGIISGFPGSTIDVSGSQILFDCLNLYGSYSRIQYSLDKSVSNSYLIGADCSLLENLSIGLAYNLFQDPTPALSHYYSLSISIGF